MTSKVAKKDEDKDREAELIEQFGEETGALIQKIIDFYDDFKVSKLDELDDIYAESVSFLDPIQRVEGRDALTAYFKHTMENVEYCHFSFTEKACTGEHLFLTWQMRFSHPKLAGGRELILQGVSQFTLRDGKVHNQSDYYDLGAMIYEHVPVIGYLVGKVKQRLEHA